MRKTQRKIISVSCFDVVVKNVHKFKPTFTLIFSLNTDSFEKLYKELGQVLYHDLNTPQKLLKVVFKTQSWCFDTVVKNYFESFIYYNNNCKKSDNDNNDN